MSPRERAAYNAYMRDYHLRRYHERRAEAITLLGGKCVRCGSAKDLEFDHIDPSTKTLEVGKMLSVSKARWLLEVRKCQLLCGQHHVDKTLKEKGQQRATEVHGTLSSYRYCKCDQCRAAKAAWFRKYRAAQAPEA